jgi:hypothetical protein
VNALSLLLAAVFGLFQVATNILAVKVRQLAGRGAYPTALAAAVFMVATGLLTHESLNHAYLITQREGYANADPELMSWLLLIVPYLEPLLFWINRVLSEPDNRRQAVQMGGVGVLTALWLYLFSTGNALAAPVHNGPAFEPQSRPVTKVRSPRQAKADEPERVQAKLLARQGMKARRIHEATGVPLSTCKLYIRQALEA